MSDLIDRDETIKQFCKNDCDCDPKDCLDKTCYEVEIIESVPSVKPTHTTPSNTLGVLDCVSREELTKRIEAYFDGLPIQVHYDMLALAQKLPSVQPDCEDCIKNGGDWECDRVHCHKGDAISRQAAILDMTCGSRTIWFQKNEPHTVYCDIRKEEWEGDFGNVLRTDGKKKHRHLVINPDIQCSFTDLPFEEESFNLVVFDPPHIEHLKQNAWMRKSYGSLDGDWRPMIRKGFKEAMRVLKVGGVLVFKWSDISISTRDIINVIGQEPLFGHRSGKKMNTHWMCYMKFEEE